MSVSSHSKFSFRPIATALIFTICLLVTLFKTSIADNEIPKKNRCKIQYTKFNETWAPLIESCREKTKVDMKNHPINQMKSDCTVEEFDFDDKCYVQCLFQGLGLLTDSGLPDKSKTLNLFDADIMEDDLFQNAVDIWNECIDDAGKIGKYRKLDNCKTLAIQAYCVEIDLGSHVYNCAYPHSLH